MRQLLQYLGDGRTVVVDVPAPGPRRGALLIRTTRSLISAGTERMLVDFGKAGWLGKARQQPEKVRAVLSKVRSDGLLATVRAVRSKLSQPIPLGYCNVGVVVADGGRKADDGGPMTEDREQRKDGRGPTTDDEPRTTDRGLLTDAQTIFKVGDRVVSNGPHAEIVSVTQDLCARIPDAVTDEAATFTPLAAIALQGINLLDVKPGDKVVVTGLGLIGQLAVRILQAVGCEVLGLDPSAERRGLAEKSGVRTASGDPVAAALGWSRGQGVAGVLITASTASNEVVNQSARSCRRRGRVVLVGVVGLQLNRADFYRNEVSFQVSCSYGARDAKLPSSARSNFEQVLAWMADGRLSVVDLISHRFDFQAAPTAYATLADRTALGVVMNYDAEASLERTVRVVGPERSGGDVGVALIGAGNFAVRSLLPAMAGLAPPPCVRTVASQQGASALLAAQACGAASATTDVDKVLGDSAVNAVFITTRHDAHARQTVAALRAGKHVWVEKPLCLCLDDLNEIESVAQIAANNPQSSVVRRPVMMVGFNRRFAPMAVALREALRGREAAARSVMTVNAGRLDSDHWTLDPRVGGGRIVGEACHFVDLMRFLAGAPIQDVRCVRRDHDGQDGGAFELRFANGASGLIDYRTDLEPHVPKETVEGSRVRALPP
jgi:predicted dehydrogenase/threonine dehydrogenase-like Zn-dependent dehydrogenase